MNNQPEDFSMLFHSKKVEDTLHKIFNGYYVTDRERKEGMKSAIDVMASEAKAKTNSETQKQSIDNQANFMKNFIESLREQNF